MPDRFLHKGQEAETDPGAALQAVVSPAACARRAPAGRARNVR